MDKNEGMVKVDLSKTPPATLEHMKVMERLNKARVQHLKKVRRKSNILSIGLVTLAVGTYLYSMAAVRQEGFLDDFEEPKLKSDKN